MRTAIVLSTALLCGCSGSQEPAWALDSVYLEPTDDGVYGFQTYNLYGEGWKKQHKGKHLICATVLELEGAETEPCADCDVAFALHSEVLESDCSGSPLPDAILNGLTAVGLGGLDPSDDVPHPGATLVGLADLGQGWEVHGWAYPDALDAGETIEEASWDGQQAFRWLASSAWPL